MIKVDREKLKVIYDNYGKDLSNNEFADKEIGDRIKRLTEYVNDEEVAIRHTDLEVLVNWSDQFCKDDHQKESDYLWKKLDAYYIRIKTMQNGILF